VLILASASPRRRELLARVGLPCEVRPADVDETPRDGESPIDYVRRVAHAKAVAIARGDHDWVLAADTTVTIGGAILGKADDEAAARAMVRRLAGGTHQVITAFAIAGPRVHAQHVVTDVTMVAMDDAAIADYVASGEWRGKAGAYAIQGIAAGLVREIRGSVTNVIGLPLAEVIAALHAVGGPAPQFARGVAS